MGALEGVQVIELAGIGPGPFCGMLLAVMGAEGAVNIIHRAELSESGDDSRRHAELVDEYREKFGDPYVAARHGWLDDVIEPSHTRRALVKALRPLLSKRVMVHPKKHGNIPL